MQFTILGSKGFIGSHLVQKLNEEGIVCNTPTSEIKSYKKNFGHVIYSIGLTADFRERPFDTVEAHVCKLHKFLMNAKFESFLYLSSTRIYSKTTNEEKPLIVNPSNFSDLYNISKLMGESLCFASTKPNVRIVRLSNVVGNNFSSNDFLMTLIRDAIRQKSIILRTSLQSEKDYISIKDVIDLLPKISLYGKHKIYNVASGKNTATKDIVNEITKKVNCKIKVVNNAVDYSFPKISIHRIQSEFKFKPTNMREILRPVIDTFIQIK